MQLYFVRHGQSRVNLGNWDELDNMDAGLTDLGHKQAAALGAWLRQHEAKAHALYSSTMRRARETAHYVGEALALSATFDDRLRELANTYVNGLPVEEANLPRTFIDQWWHEAPFAARTQQFAGAESWMHMRIRLAQLVDELTHKHLGQQVYVVAHGGIIDAMFDNVFNIGPFRRCESHTYNAAWSLFEYTVEARRPPWHLRHHNRVDHLDQGDLT